MSHVLPIDENTSKRLVRDMNRQGFAVLENAFDAPALDGIQQYVERQAARHKNQYFAYHGYAALADSALAALGASAEFRAQLDHLHQLGTGRAAASSEIYPVLRCVQGGSGRRESNAFHFDATLLTVLVPIFTPQGDQERGDLMLFPNTRSVRSSVLFNALEKAVFQNTLSRRLITWLIDKRWLKPVTLPVVPGNVYFFWGYRSLHANQPCHPQFRRATALFHYGDPHAGSLTTRLILKFNQHRARKAVAKSSTEAS